jgi:hypothetical protein
MSIISDQLAPVLDKLEPDIRAIIVAAIEGFTTSGSALVEQLGQEVAQIVDRLDGATLSITIRLKNSKVIP